MGLFSLANLFGITLRESADDGSDFTNPDADYRRVFLGEDGNLHAKDSSGTVTSLSGSGGVTVEDEGTPLSTTATTLDFVGAGVTATGSGAEKTITIPGTGSNAIPTVEQYDANGGSGTSLVNTITAAAVGKRLIVAVGSEGRDVNTPTCTNVTFTEVGATNFSTTTYVSVYVGIVSGSPSGTSVTVTATGSNFIFMDVWVVADTLTPTAGTPVTLTNTNAASLTNNRGLTCAATRGTFFVFLGMQDDNTTPLRFSMSAAHAPGSITNAFVTAIGYAPGGSFTIVILAGTTNSDFAGIVIPIT